MNKKYVMSPPPEYVCEVWLDPLYPVIYMVENRRAEDQTRVGHLRYTTTWEISAIWLA